MWNKTVSVTLSILIFGFIAFTIYSLIVTWSSDKCKISDGTHTANIDSFPPAKFVLSDYIVVQVKNAEITEIYNDNGKVEKHNYELDADSTVIVKGTDGGKYKIRIIK